MGGIHGCYEYTCAPPCAKGQPASEHTQHRRNGERQQPECYPLPEILLEMEHINLHRSKKHQVEDAYLSENLKTRISGKKIEPIGSNRHTRKYEPDNLGNPQPAEDYRAEQDNQQHQQENRHRLSERECDQ